MGGKDTYIQLIERKCEELEKQKIYMYLIWVIGIYWYALLNDWAILN